MKSYYAILFLENSTYSSQAAASLKMLIEVGNRTVNLWRSQTKFFGGIFLF